MAAFTELFIDAGSDFREVISIIDDTTGLKLNLAAYNVTSQIRRSYYSRNPSANFDCSVADIQTGNVNLLLPGSISYGMRPGTYVFDVVAENSGYRSRIMEGIIILTPAVTRSMTTPTSNGGDDIVIITSDYPGLNFSEYRDSGYITIVV